MWTFGPIKAKGKDTMPKANGGAEGLYYFTVNVFLKIKKHTLKH